MSECLQRGGYELTAYGAGCKTITTTDDGYRIESDTPKAVGGVRGASPCMEEVVCEYFCECVCIDSAHLLRAWVRATE